MTYKCVVRFAATVIELCVVPQPPTAWRWSICLPDGPTLETGLSNSLTRAQTTAQYRLADRLRRAGIELSPTERFRWREELDS